MRVLYESRTATVMAATLHNTLPEYFINEPSEKDTLMDAAGSSVLLTPDNTPTKESHTDTSSSLLINDISVENPSNSNEWNLGDRTSLTRSTSDSRVDSPAPTQSKLTRSELTVEHVVHSKPPSSRQCGHGRGRAGRSKKELSKAKSLNTKSESGVKKELKQNTRSKEKPAPKTRRSHSVPEARSGSHMTNTLLTDYFPIRRSSRMSSSEVKKKQQKELEDKILSGCEDGLKVVQIEGKGRGVISTKAFKHGEFVVEYSGDLVDAAEAKKREAQYSENPDFGCYMYYFNYKDKRFCIDATKETDKLGRLLNHSRLNGNCVTKVVGIKDKPYLILVAAKDIDVGEELLYDYGDRSKKAIQTHPWLAL